MKGKINKKINKKDCKETTKNDRMLWKDLKHEDMKLKELRRRRKELLRRLLEERTFFCIEDKQKLKKR